MKCSGSLGSSRPSRLLVQLAQIDAVTSLDALKVPPGNRLHALTGDLRRWHAVRVNDKYRLVFRFEGADAFDVRCTDYH